MRGFWDGSFEDDGKSGCGIVMKWDYTDQNGGNQ